MFKHYLAIGFAVIITVFAQLFLKKGANYGVKKKSLLSLYLNKYSLTGFSLFLIVTLLSLFALQKLELKELVFILPMTYLLLPLLSKLYLKEELSNMRILGMLFIILGILVFNLNKIIPS